LNISHERVEGVKTSHVYSSINMWSTENAGKLFDLNAEVELWTRAGHIKINLQKGVDIRKFDRLIAEAIFK